MYFLQKVKIRSSYQVCRTGGAPGLTYDENKFWGFLRTDFLQILLVQSEMIITWNEGVYTASRIIPINRYSYGDEIANTGQGIMREWVNLEQY